MGRGKRRLRVGMALPAPRSPVPPASDGSDARCPSCGAALRHEIPTELKPHYREGATFTRLVLLKVQGTDEEEWLCPDCHVRWPVKGSAVPEPLQAALDRDRLDEIKRPRRRPSALAD